jgi:hypothetical protein
MWSIVRKLILIAHIVAPIGVVQAADHSPHVLRDPLLGLQYDQLRVQFESVPADLISACPTLADRETIKSNWFIYARAGDSESTTFYIVGGYSVRTIPRPPDLPRFEMDAPGVIFSIEDGKCTVFEEPALEMFRPRLAGEISDRVLSALARDHANRAVAAFGGTAKLLELVRKQKIAIDQLPSPLRKAYSAILK